MLTLTFVLTEVTGAIGVVGLAAALIVISKEKPL